MKMEQLSENLYCETCPVCDEEVYYHIENEEYVPIAGQFDCGH